MFSGVLSTIHKYASVTCFGYWNCFWNWENS